MRPWSLAALALPLALCLGRPAAAQGPRESLTIGITQFPSNWHPNIEAMAAKSYIEGFARRPVTAYGPDWKLACLQCVALPTLENGLAVRETTPDGKPGLRVTWKLGPGWAWADGTPVSAEDFRFAWEAGRAFETGFGGAEFYRSAYELIIDGPDAVTLRFDKVTFDFASLGDFQPLPARIERPIWEADKRGYRNRTAYDTDTANPGLWNGPYRLASVTPGSGATLLRNEHWAGPAPAFSRITIRTVENTPALEAQLLAGQVDMVAGELGLPLEQAMALEKRAGNRFRFHYQPGLVWEHIDLNLDNPILADRRIRQALLMAIDREQIARRLFDGRQAISDTGVNPLDAMHDPAAPRWSFDPARAAALLDEAGWAARGPDGIRRNAAGEKLALDFMTTAGNRSREQVQQILASMWKQAGIEARIRNEPPRVFFSETVSKRRFGAMAMFAWISSPESVPRSTLHSSEIPTAERNWSGQNYPGFRYPRLDAIIDALPQELDPAARRPLWAELQAITGRELPVLPLWFRADAHIWPQWLQGVVPTGHQAPSSVWVTDWRAR